MNFSNIVKQFFDYFTPEHEARELEINKADATTPLLIWFHHQRLGRSTEIRVSQALVFFCIHLYVIRYRRGDKTE